jgi:hypothetical protein
MEIPTYPNEELTATDHVLLDVEVERARQNGLKAVGKFHWTCADDGIRTGPMIGTRVLQAEKLSVLAEEFGEVARLVTETVIDPSRHNPRELKKELIQVAAVAVAWCEALDREIDKL